ncbi:NUDIX domain-containing protein [Pedococcus sp. KACC 23699]|uniref:NUDIX domain-containing protein n=1 Tax=Pedococcus sp. KACC 23699 TaxID=3149228 RepID=A0AAU7JVX3_9MICO
MSTPVRVHGRAPDGRAVSFVLEHGADPVRELVRRGWTVDGLVDAHRDTDGSLALRYAVDSAPVVGPPSAPGPAPVPAEPVPMEPVPTAPVPTAPVPTAPVPMEPGPADPVPTDPGLVVEPGEAAQAYQRTAAYGVVTSERGVLLTELSALTSSPGRWTLPGGGLDPGEEPVAALHREVWEESGQRVEGVRLLEAHTSHWIGRAPSRRLEDFHAIRIVYAAWCPSPTDPVVHDVGGSTESVRWVRVEDLGHYHLGRSFAPHMKRWLGRA